MTEEIGTQITSTQQVTDDAVGAIDRIAKTIGNINETSSTIASAVGQQGPATSKISRNIQEAAAGTESVTKSIQVVKSASEGTGGASGEVAAGNPNVFNECLVEAVLGCEVVALDHPYALNTDERLYQPC